MSGLGLLGGLRLLRPLGLLRPLRPLRPLGLLRPLRPLGLLGLLAFASCGEDPVASEVPEAPGPPAPADTAPIAFGGTLAGEETVTRADTPLEQTTKAFRVYGYKNMSFDDTDSYGDPQQVFPGYRVRWTENSAYGSTTNTDGWEYVNQQALGEEEQTIKYWDWSAKAYRFFAVAGATGTNTVTGTTATEDGVTVYRVTYKADATNEAKTPYYSKLWFSNGSTPGDKEFGKPVRLEFVKPLSTVRFLFIFEDPAKAPTTELTAKDFRPTSGTTIKMKGDVSVAYPLEGTDITENFSATSEAEGMTAMTRDYYESVAYQDDDPTKVVVSPYLNADASLTNKEYTVLPVANQGSYTLTVSVNGQPKSTVVPADFMQWKPGFKYTYIFKIHVDEGVSISSVQAAFSPWTDREQTTTVYNW